MVVLGLRGKVVWLTFWSARSPSAQADLRALDAIRTRLVSRPRFTLLAAAIDADRPAEVRAAVAAARVSLPVYLASPQTRRAYGVARTPLHLLLGPDGRVLAAAQGSQPATLARLQKRAEEALDRLEPPTRQRFALRYGNRIGALARQNQWTRTRKRNLYNCCTSLKDASVSRSGRPWPKQRRAGSRFAIPRGLAGDRIRRGKGTVLEEDHHAVASVAKCGYGGKSQSRFIVCNWRRIARRSQS
jgi:hypothetical protein